MSASHISLRPMVLRRWAARLIWKEHIHLRRIRSPTGSRVYFSLFVLLPFSSCFCHRNSSQFSRKQGDGERLHTNGICPVNLGKHIDICKCSWQTEFITSRRDLPSGTGALLRLLRSLKVSEMPPGPGTFVHRQPKTRKVVFAMSWLGTCYHVNAGTETPTWEDCF